MIFIHLPHCPNNLLGIIAECQVKYFMSSKLFEVSKGYHLVAAGDFYSVSRKEGVYFLSSNRAIIKRLSVYDIVTEDTEDTIDLFLDLFWERMLNSNSEEVLGRKAKNADKLDLLDGTRKQIRDLCRNERASSKASLVQSLEANLWTSWLG
ncbi:unnamed protein product [Allacma fusca]|uniref:Uncharacterized protein n=1 Tax=Allacma fusca TaxID=39272 RepID=A0A8J2JNR9_9HEXA|nr:unnamed protein product [Allacma fusca]